ncbi:MAG: methyltransferase [Bacteroidales bacterium]|nr:methyltransferase [Bacteroidales bacterium]
MEKSDTELHVNRPKPMALNIDVIPYKRRMDPQIAIDALIDGYNVLIVDYYSSGLTVLSELKNYLKRKYSDQSFQGQRDFRSAFRELSHRLLLKLSNHKIVVRKAPQIGWLDVLYPEIKEFLLPFPQIQGLNSSWQWFEKGIFIPVLKKKIHPWFGVYFPTRFEHLELFDNWIKKYKGEKKNAIDIGIGSGVLSFQILKQGFEKVYGTDSNPNAIVGLKEYLEMGNLKSKIDLFHGDLFANCNVKTELIVFNPPWIPDSQASDGIDKAIYYEAELFSRFFEEATKHLEPNGRVVLLFSNLAQITKVGENHPIEIELSEGGRFEKELLVQKKVRAASKNTQRNQNWRSSEIVELWVLKMLTNK